VAMLMIILKQVYPEAQYWVLSSCPRELETIPTSSVPVPKPHELINYSLRVRVHCVCSVCPG
jgi:hypothetical protein